MLAERDVSCQEEETQRLAGMHSVCACICLRCTLSILVNSKLYRRLRKLWGNTCFTAVVYAEQML